MRRPKARVVILSLAALLAACTTPPPEQVEPLPHLVPKPGLSVVMAGSVDLKTGRAVNDFAIRNLSDKADQLRLTHPLTPTESRKLELAPGAVGSVRFAGEVRVASLTTHTKHTRLRSYLLERPENAKDRMLLVDHEVSLVVSLPRGARLLKSTVPFTVDAQNVAQWQVKQIGIIPPIDIWYTTSPDDVQLSSEATEEDGRVAVTVEVMNVTERRLANLRLSAQFPGALYLASAAESDGEFQLMQGVMYRWRAVVATLEPGASRTLSFVFI